MPIMKVDRQYNWKLIKTEGNREYWVVDNDRLMLMVIQDGRGVPQVGETVDVSTGIHDGTRYPDYVSIPRYRWGKISVRSRGARGKIETTLSAEMDRAPRSPK